jgi:hypothetical protein
VALTLRWGTVTAVSQRFEELVRCEVDGTACVGYPRQTGAVEVGDTVLVNTQARDLELGSGGFDVLYANLTRGLGLLPPVGAHVMGLPYTTAQAAVGCVEEHDALAESLDGLPIVCCGLHSQLAPVVAGIGSGVRVAYAQLAGGALPVALSDTIRLLKTRRLLETTVAVAPCLDADVQALTVASALAWAKARDFDVVVCGIGPGIVGSGSALGHGGMAVAEAANVAAALGGAPIVVVRYSTGDPRERHQGVSHHTLSALELVLGEHEVAWPAELQRDSQLGDVVAVDVDGWEEACENLPLVHMGRGPADDPWFFAAAFAAGKRARAKLG